MASKLFLELLSERNGLLNGKIVTGLSFWPASSIGRAIDS